MKIGNLDISSVKLGTADVDLYLGDVLLNMYEPLEYISSTATGGQYINLGCKLLENTDDIHIDIKFKINGKGKDNSNQSVLFGNQGPTNPWPGFNLRIQDPYIEVFAKWEFTNCGEIKDNRYYHYLIRRQTESISRQDIFNISWTLDNIPNNQLSSTLNTCLFCNAISTNSAANFINADLYFCKIRKGDLYINLIPVRKKSTNEVGMYDIESGNFYVSEGSEPFVAHRFPSDIYEGKYRKLQYIRSTRYGGEFIDLGTKLMETNEDVQIDIKFEYVGKGYENLDQAALLTLNYEDNATWPGIVLRDRKNAGGKLELETKCNFTGSVTTDNKKYYYAFNNGTETFPTYGKDIIFEESMLINNIPDSQCHSGSTYIFSSYRYYNTQGPWRYSEAILYYLKLYKDGILIHDLIPVMRIKDNIAGLYDKVNKIFYKSNGEYELQAGPMI